MTADSKSRKQMVSLLEERLADLVDLMLRMEWEQRNLKEPSFTALRDLFDKVWADSKEYGERIAGRMAELGGTVLEGRMRLAGLRKRADLPWYPPAAFGAQEQVAVLSDRVSAFRRQIRFSLQAAEEVEDKKTADLFRKMGRCFDRYVWLADAARPER